MFRVSEAGSHSSTGWPRTYNVVQVGLELAASLLSSPGAIGMSLT